jgi:hypothetical protein
VRDEPTDAMSASVGGPGPAVPLAATEIADATANDVTEVPQSGGARNPLWIFAIGLGFLFGAMAAVLMTGYQ